MHGKHNTVNCVVEASRLIRWYPSQKVSEQNCSDFHSAKFKKKTIVKEMTGGDGEGGAEGPCPNPRLQDLLAS